MVKKALGSLLFATLPIGAALTGCSSVDAAENQPLHKMGDHSSSNPSTSRPAAAGDAELNNKATTSEGGSSTAKAPSTTSRPSGQPGSAHSSATSDPYLPPQAYIPPSDAPDNQPPVGATTSNTTPESSAEVSAPIPHKPVPLVADDDANHSPKPDHSEPTDPEGPIPTAGEAQKQPHADSSRRPSNPSVPQPASVSTESATALDSPAVAGTTTPTAPTSPANARGSAVHNTPTVPSAQPE